MRCWYRDQREGLGEWQRGELHLFTTDHIEYENGPGPFPVGVIQNIETGQMYSIPVDQISLADEKP